MPLGKKIRIYYDPRGQAVKTVNPDDSFQTVFFGEVSDLAHPENYTPSPWVSFTYDANDNGGRRPAGRGLTPVSNIDTPQSSEKDALGRTTKNTEHNAHYNGSTYEDVVMQYKYDLRGNLLEVTDPNGRIAFAHKYDYANRGLWTQHIDSGTSLINMDVMGKPIEATDAKGANTLSSYDLLNRPIRLWAKDKTGASRTLRQYMIYGDDLTATGYTDTQTKDLNLYGKGWKAFDEAGMVHTEEYDFKGNLLEKTRRVIKDSELLSVFSGPPANWQVTPYLVDWTGLPVSTLLDTPTFVTTMEYDALNRAMKVTYPQDVNGNRKELIPTYNRAGTLTSVQYDGTEYLKEVACNAKGQPLLTAYGNGVMTRYVYDEDTFRTVRLKSEGYTYNHNPTTRTHTYAYNSGSTKQDFAYEYDLIGNIMKLHDRTPDCGISATPDALDRLFNYDPLYRVLSATGRESNGTGAAALWNDAPVAGSPNASNCRSYLQTFEYDKLGNMMELGHTASGNNYTRNYVYNNYSTNNKLSQINNGSSTPIVYSNFTYDANGNMNASDTDRNYVWDAADQLKAFYIQAGTSEPSIYAQYLYSGGQRIKKIVRTSGGDYEVTVYDGPFEYCKKVSGSTTYEKNYSQIEGGVEIRTGTAFPGDISDDITYQLSDNLGSSNLRLSTTGTIIDKEEYYPFGDTSLRTFTYKRYRYVGKEKDSESGLYYYGARYYASWTCRFISVDPLAAKYSFYTPYQYAGNKPINSIDIDGLEATGNTGQENNANSSPITVPTFQQALDAEYNNSPRIAYSVDGTRAYNYAPDGHKNWDYADWTYNEELGDYAWEYKKLPEPSVASNNIATCLFDGNTIIDKSTQDVVNTVAVARGEELYVRQRALELYDGDNFDKSVAGLSPDATWGDMIGVAKSEYWTQQIAENNKSGSSAIDFTPGIFGVPRQPTGNAIQPVYIEGDVISLGASVLTKKVLTLGALGLTSLFSKKSIPIVLSKAERLKIFASKVTSAPKVNSPDEVILMINKNLDEVEDMYSGVVKNIDLAKMPNRGDGRMYGILDDTYVTRHANGDVTAFTKGHKIEIKSNGSFSIYSRINGELFISKN
ncbi:MAG: RHS repeat-associated core domain-containing protein [Bacteroidota bacterium]